MNKQRLLELAGVSSNMNNPSQQPYTEIPGSDGPLGAGGSKGYQELGGDGEDFSRDDDVLLDRTIEKMIPRIKEAAFRGMSAESKEEAHDAFREILDALGEGEDE